MVLANVEVSKMEVILPFHVFYSVPCLGHEVVVMTFIEQDGSSKALTRLIFPVKCVSSSSLQVSTVKPLQLDLWPNTGKTSLSILIPHQAKHMLSKPPMKVPFSLVPYLA